MQAKDISWLEFLKAIHEGKGRHGFSKLCKKYPEKIVIAKFTIANKKGYLEYGVSILSPWLTEKGIETLISLQGGDSY